MSADLKALNRRMSPSFIRNGSAGPAIAVIVTTLVTGFRLLQAKPWLKTVLIGIPPPLAAGFIFETFVHGMQQ